jgi:hypothetical protein
MRLPDDHPVKALPGPGPEPDPVQVQGELHAYLVQRGQQVARDMDLGHVQPHDLAELGRLDCIAQHPGLDPELATHLEMIASTREHNPHAWDGGRGVTAGHDQHQHQDQDQAQQAPETHTSRIVRANARSNAQPNDFGQGSSYWREVRRTQQSKHLDHPDEEWT